MTPRKTVKETEVSRRGAPPAMIQKFQPMLENLETLSPKDKVKLLLENLSAIAKKAKRSERSWHEEEAVQQLIDVLFITPSTDLFGSKEKAFKAIAKASTVEDALKGADRAFGPEEALALAYKSSKSNTHFFRFCKNAGYSLGAFEVLVKQTSPESAFRLAAKLTNPAMAFELVVHNDQLALNAYKLLADVVGDAKAFEIVSKFCGPEQAKKLRRHYDIPIKPELVESVSKALPS